MTQVILLLLLFKLRPEELLSQNPCNLIAKFIENVDLLSLETPRKRKECFHCKNYAVKAITYFIILCMLFLVGDVVFYIGVITIRVERPPRGQLHLPVHTALH